MAKRGTSKRYADDHENWIADQYDGVRSRSSGGADNDQGDVRSSTHLLECKVVTPPKNGNAPKVPRFVRELEKVTEEAWSEGRVPALALRYYDPDSLLADSQGWIDLVVYRVEDDLDRPGHLGEDDAGS